MNRIIRTGLGLAAFWAVALAPAFSSEAYAFKRTEIGGKAADFTLETLDGAPHTLSALLGPKATIIVFWASWSPRSLELLTDAQTYFEEHGSKGLAVVAVNTEHQEWDPAAADAIRETAAKAGVAFPSLVDKNLAVYDEYGVIAVPSAVLVDGGRTVQSLVMSYGTFSRAQFKEDVERALGIAAAPAVADEAQKGYKPKGTAERYLMMARKLIEKKRFTRAVEPLEHALREDPEYAEAYRALAEVYTHMEKPDDAAAAVKKAEQWESAHGSAAPAPVPPAGKDAGEGPSSEAKPAGDGTQLVPERRAGLGA